MKARISVLKKWLVRVQARLRRAISGSSEPEHTPYNPRQGQVI